MITQKGIVLDANILLRAALGLRVRQILKKCEDEVRFYAPDIAFADARKYVFEISQKQHIDSNLGLGVLDQMTGLVEQVDCSLYEQHERPARDRIESARSR